MTKDKAIKLVQNFLEDYSQEERIALARACLIASIAVLDGAFGIESAMEIVSMMANQCSEFSREIA